MGISVYEALQLPMMSQTKLVAGTNGLHNMIKWVTVVEVIEDINRLQEGEFLITTGYGLNENRERFHELLAMKKLSGVAIYTRFYLDTIPETFKDIANKNDLPLIEIPTDINFSKLTKEILQQILNKQMDLISFSLNIHKELTGLVLKNQGEHIISTTLADLINTSIYVVNDVKDTSHHILKHENVSFHNEEIIIEETPMELKKYMEKCKKNYQSLAIEMKNFKTILFPIVANERYYGMIIAFKELEKWTEIDLTAIEHAATVYAIEYMKESAIDQTQIRLRGEFLEEILHISFKNSTIALERGKKLGFDLSLTQAVFYLKFTTYDKSDHIKKLVHALYNHTFFTMEGQGRQLIIKENLEGVTILAEVKPSKYLTPKQDCFNVAKVLTEKWEKKHPDQPLLIGIGKAYDHVNKLSQSAIEAKYACDLASLLLSEKTIIHYDDLGTYHLLLQMKDLGIDLKQFYEEHIGELIMHNNKGIDLIHTLEIYFKHNLNIQLTASNLFVHRHTLKYRLIQIEKRTGYNLRSADERLKMQLAIAAYKLDKYFSKSE